MNHDCFWEDDRGHSKEEAMKDLTPEPFECEAKTAGGIIEKIKPLLADKPPSTQGAVLADLLATWLAGHMGGGSELQEQLLAMHIEMVRALIPVNEAIIISSFGEGSKR